MDLARNDPLIRCAAALLGAASLAGAQAPALGGLGGRTLFVDAGAPCAGATGSASAPYCRIQDAIDAADDGDRVLVGPGTYAELIDFGGKAIAVRSLAGPGTTAISGAGSFGSTVVTFDDGEGRDAMLLGFTVRSGSSRGILCDGASPTVRGNVIRNNAGQVPGAGIACLNGADALIAYNEIRDNHVFPLGGDGGGIFVASSSPTIVGNRILRNLAEEDTSGRGGGICLLSSSSLVANNLIAENEATDPIDNFGGGIFCADSDLVLTGNTIVGNRCEDGISVFQHGGGLYVQDSTVLIESSIVWDNVAATASGIYVDGASTVTVRYSDFALAGVVVAAGGVLTQGPGNVSVAPGFVDAAGDDWHLTALSPLVDAGDPLTAPGGFDGDLEPRVVDGDGDLVPRIDMGWDEVFVAPLGWAPGRRAGSAGARR